jgi:hypothetical protein
MNQIKQKVQGTIYVDKDKFLFSIPISQELKRNILPIHCYNLLVNRAINFMELKNKKRCIG